MTAGFTPSPFTRFCSLLCSLSHTAPVPKEMAPMDNMRHFARAALAHPAKRHTCAWSVHRLGLSDGLAEVPVVVANRQRRAGDGADRSRADSPLDGAQLSCVAHLHSCSDWRWHGTAWCL